MSFVIGRRMNVNCGYSESWGGTLRLKSFLITGTNFYKLFEEETDETDIFVFVVENIHYAFWKLILTQKISIVEIRKTK